ncbi:MAG: chemotaxis protein CheW [Myxococcota bacterium]
MAEPARFLDEALTLATFRLADGQFAVEVTELRQIIHYSVPTRLPRAPRLIEGIVDIRDAVLPVVDLGRALGLEALTPSPSSRILVAEIDGLAVGLAVDAATGMQTVGLDRLEDPPPLVGQLGYGAARGVIRRSGEAPIIVLCLESLLESIHRSALDDRSPTSKREDAA